MKDIEIYCPKCHWEPDEQAYWMCSCGHMWNTFSTGGRCPACKKVWEHTQCLACNKWSPHLDWYHGLNNIVQQFKEEVLKEWKETV